MSIKPRVTAIIQARMGSTRLPGKILKEVNGKTLLEYQLERVKRATLLNDIVVATTTKSEDDPIVSLCAHIGVPVYRGSEEDVLSRYYEAARQYESDIIVRLTSDCPLIEPEVIDLAIQHFLENENSLDYVSNTLERTYPRGLDVEVFSMRVLEKAMKDAILPRDREHVTAYIYTHEDLFNMSSITNDQDESGHRWTVDTQEDFNLVSKIVMNIYPSNPQFHWTEVLNLLNEHPEWKKINATIEQKQI